MVVIVVAPEIILEAATSEWEDIVVRFVPTRTIIIVHCLLWIIIVDPEIFGDGTVQRDVGVFPISCHIEWLPVPRVEASVILRLPDHIEDQIPLEPVTTASTVGSMASALSRARRVRLGLVAARSGSGGGWARRGGSDAAGGVRPRREWWRCSLCQ